MENADRNLLLDEIRDILEIIEEQTNSFRFQEERIPRIELDIVMANIRKLYEKVYRLQRQNERETQHESLPEITPAPSEGIRIRFDSAPESAGNIATTTEIPPPTSQNKPTEPPQAPRPVAAAQKPTPSTRTVTAPTLFPDEPQSFREKAKEETPSVADRISGQIEDKSVASNLMHMPLADIRAAIGINEKFLFINELFSGSLQEYNQAIQSLNQARDEEDAMTAFEDYAGRYKWNPRLPAVSKLKELVKRRFL
jgi:TolA-binding protein